MYYHTIENTNQRIDNIVCFNYMPVIIYIFVACGEPNVLVILLREFWFTAAPNILRIVINCFLHCINGYCVHCICYQLIVW